MTSLLNAFQNANYSIRNRKRLAHALLISETINMLRSRFVPDIPFIKQQIADLIEREYLERSGPEEYSYLA
jgi:hypothetical protein